MTICVGILFYRRFEVSIFIELSLEEGLLSYVCNGVCYSSASVTGLNNNEYQIARGKVHSGLSLSDIKIKRI